MHGEQVLTLRSAVLYIFFKLFLKSKVVKLSSIDFQTEFAKIDEEKRLQEHLEVADGTFRTLYSRMRQAVSRRA